MQKREIGSQVRHSGVPEWFHTSQQASPLPLSPVEKSQAPCSSWISVKYLYDITGFTHTGPFGAGNEKWFQPRSSDVVPPFQVKLDITISSSVPYIKNPLKPCVVSGRMPLNLAQLGVCRSPSWAHCKLLLFCKIFRFSPVFTVFVDPSSDQFSCSQVARDQGEEKYNYWASSCDKAPRSTLKEGVDRERKSCSPSYVQGPATGKGEERALSAMLIQRRTREEKKTQSSMLARSSSVAYIKNRSNRV